MKSDTTTTALNFILATLVILGAVFASLSMWHVRELRHLNAQAQMAQFDLMRVQSLANAVAVYNEKAKSPELTQILQSAQAHQSAASAVK